MSCLLPKLPKSDECMGCGLHKQGPFFAMDKSEYGTAVSSVPSAEPMRCVFDGSVVILGLVTNARLNVETMRTKHSITFCSTDVSPGQEGVLFYVIQQRRRGASLALVPC